jgi:thiamine biosynthesis lipoprotein
MYMIFIYLCNSFIKHRSLYSRTFCTLSLLLVCGACTPEKEKTAEYFVFGTIVEVKLWGVTEPDASQAFSDLQQLFQNMHHDWHAWETGQLTAINQAFAQGQPASADPDIIEMLQRSQILEKSSGGRFNPAIGALIRLWGFHTSDYPIIGPPPSQTQINKILDLQPSSLDIRINGQQLWTDNPAVQLDFGGIAKGYAVDIAIRHLHELGINNAIVNAGGDLRASGSHGDRPWQIALRKPGGGVIGTLQVQTEEAIFTSGNYERFRQDDKQRYPHIIDPRSGWPSRDIASVTVIAAEGLVADAAATALVVAGLEEWPSVAAAMALNQVAVVDQAGTVFLSPAMEQRILLSEGVQKVVIDIEADKP